MPTGQDKCSDERRRAGLSGAALNRGKQQAVHDRGVITASGAAPVTFARKILYAIGLGSPELFEYLGMYGEEHHKG